jgi:hypothetical protein
MPLEYKAILDQYEFQMQIRERTLAMGTDPLNEVSLPPSSPTRWPEVDTPAASPPPGGSCEVKEKHPTTAIQSSPFTERSRGVSRVLEETSSRLPVAPTIAEELIKKYNLKPTLEDAQELQNLLKRQESEYARRSSHQKLCERTGTAAERKQLQKEDKAIPLPTVCYISRKKIEERDEKRRVGNAMINEHASDPNFGAAEKLLKWIDHKPLIPLFDNEVAQDSAADQKLKEDGLSEVTVEAHVGPLVKGIFWGHQHLKESE